MIDRTEVVNGETRIEDDGSAAGTVRRGAALLD